MNFKTASTLLMAGLTVASLISGCGKTSPAAASSTRLPGRAPLQGAYPAPGAIPYGNGAPQLGAGLPGAPGGPGDAQQVLAAVRLAQQSQRGFTGTILTYEKGPKGDTETDTLSIAYKRPSTLRLEMTHASGQAQGCKVLWDGSDSLKVKPTFMPFSVGVGIGDSRVVSKNGWTIKETDVSCILGVVLDPGAQVRNLGPQTIDGKAVTLLEVHSPKSPHGVTLEQIGIDMQMNLPVVRLMYMGKTLAYKLVAKTFRLQVPTDDQLSI
jgi:hypothetical protein